MAASVWYFAYGSNMNRAQMRSRAGEIFEEQQARLENFEPVFSKKARGGSATANIRPAPGKIVYGVLYKIPEPALRALDRFEGVPEHYRRIEVSVADSDGNKIAAQAYIATKVEKGLRPALLARHSARRRGTRAAGRVHCRTESGCGRFLMEFRPSILHHGGAPPMESEAYHGHDDRNAAGHEGRSLPDRILPPRRHFHPRPVER